MTFKESDTISPGSELCVFDADAFKVGLAICYDARFAELAMLYTKLGCNLLIYPSAFKMTTGPAHWQLLMRARANDNQLYVAGVSPARDESAGFAAYGHSMIVSPWAEVIQEADETEQIISAELDADYVLQVRNQIPMSKQKRPDIHGSFELKGKIL